MTPTSSTAAPVLTPAGALAGAPRGVAPLEELTRELLELEQLPAGDVFRWAPQRLIDLVIAARPELPPGWANVRRDETSAWWLLARRKLRVCELLERRAGELWHHVIITHPTRAVRLDEIQEVRDLFIGAEREVLMVLGALPSRVRLASCRGRDNPLVPPVAIVSGGAPVSASPAGGREP